MTITKRTLERWRKEALYRVEAAEDNKPLPINVKEENNRILRLTQELLDQHLIRRKS